MCGVNIRQQFQIKLLKRTSIIEIKLDETTRAYLVCIGDVDLCSLMDLLVSDPSSHLSQLSEC